MIDTVPEVNPGRPWWSIGGQGEAFSAAGPQGGVLDLRTPDGSNDAEERFPIPDSGETGAPPLLM